MRIVKLYHADHDVKKVHLDFLEKVFSSLTLDSFFIESVFLLSHLPEIKSGLYGPTEGDDPVLDGQKFRASGLVATPYYGVRRGRKYASRLIDLPYRKANYLIAIGEVKNGDIRLFTAYGSIQGVPSEREPGDQRIETMSGIIAAREFWAEHALCGNKDED